MGLENKQRKKIECILSNLEVTHGQSDIDDLVQDCSNSSALAMELLQSCTKPSIWSDTYASVGLNELNTLYW